MNDLVHTQGADVAFFGGDLKLNHQGVSRDQPGGQSAPVLVVAVVKAANEFDVVSVPQEEFCALRKMELREVNAHGERTGGFHHHAPHRSFVFLCPRAVFEPQVHIKFFSKAPGGTFDFVGDGICSLQSGQINGGHALNLKRFESGCVVPKREPSLRDLAVCGLKHQKSDDEEGDANEWEVHLDVSWGSLRKKQLMWWREVARGFKMASL